MPVVNKKPKRGLKEIFDLVNKPLPHRTIIYVPDMKKFIKAIEKFMNKGKK